MIDYSDYEPRYREPPENFRISKRGGYSKPDRKRPKSGISCEDCTNQYQHCTWEDPDRNKNWGKKCEQIIKNKKCPRKCTIYRTLPELERDIKNSEQKLSTIQKELIKLKWQLENQK